MRYHELTFADCLTPAWRVSPRVRALVTTRAGGVSQPPYGRFITLTRISFCTTAWLTKASRR